MIPREQPVVADWQRPPRTTKHGIMHSVADWQQGAWESIRVTRMPLPIGYIIQFVITQSNTNKVTF